MVLHKISPLDFAAARVAVEVAVVGIVDTGFLPGVVIVGVVSTFVVTAIEDGIVIVAVIVDTSLVVEDTLVTVLAIAVAATMLYDVKELEDDRDEQLPCEHAHRAVSNFT